MMVPTTKKLLTAALSACMAVVTVGWVAADTGSGEESGTRLTLAQTYDTVRGGARLILSYDAAAKAFTGTVENTTDATLKRARVEVHLSNGVELGPTTPQDLAPGEKIAVRLDAAGQIFTGWTPHAEVGGGEGGGEHGVGHESGGEGRGEHGSGGERSAEDGEESGATLTLDQIYDTVRKGARLIMGYDKAVNAFFGTVLNTTNATLSQVRVEVHLSNGIELGPTRPIDLPPGRMIAVRMGAPSQDFTGWTPHAEVGPQFFGGEGGGEHGAGRESGGEGRGEHGSGRERGGEHGSGGDRRTI